MSTEEIIAHFWFAILSVLVYPFVAYAIYKKVKNPHTALMLAYLGGLMFLPERVMFDLPLLPPMGKQEFAALMGIIGLRKPLKARFKKRGFLRGPEAIVILLAIGCFLTAKTNTDSVIYGFHSEFEIKGMEMYDGLSDAIREFVFIATPFYLGRIAYQEGDDLRHLMLSLAKAGLIYSLFCWVEFVMSPQLHDWVYNFKQHEFNQCRRWGGWRPMVFMQHGLAVANFMMMAAVASNTVARAKQRVWGIGGTLVAWYSNIMLVLMKSTGAVMYGLVTIPLTKFARISTLARVIGVLVFLTMLYPISKIGGFFPDKALIQLSSEMVAAERGDSLAFRFRNEAELVERTRERLWFGWGGYNRGHIYAGWGQDMTVTDGYWIILLNTRGVWGLGFTFLVLLVPLMSAARNLRKIKDKKDQLLVAVLGVSVAFLVIDLLPNGLFNNLPYFLTGALWGLVKTMSDPKYRAQRGGRRIVPLPIPMVPMPPPQTALPVAKTR
ncbi:MAG: hypothetical protein U1E65_02390 [Myxococcota bacterium]